MIVEGGLVRWMNATFVCVCVGATLEVQAVSVCTYLGLNRSAVTCIRPQSSDRCSTVTFSPMSARFTPEEHKNHYFSHLKHANKHPCTPMRHSSSQVRYTVIYKTCTHRRPLEHLFAPQNGAAASASKKAEQSANIFNQPNRLSLELLHHLTENLSEPKYTVLLVVITFLIELQ